MTILATIIVLGVLIFVHELGHFLAAKAVGIEVERFSIGLGPRVTGFTWGETEYVLSAVPLGGYVKMGGMEDEVMEALEGGGSEGEREPGPRDFDGKPIWARTLVISAGVIMNFLFAFGAYAATMALWGVREQAETRVGQVEEQLLPDGAESLARLQPRDEIEAVGSREVEHWGDLREAILEGSPGPTTVRVQGSRGPIEFRLSSGEDERRRTFMALRPWREPEVGLVNPGSPADDGGVEQGDRIVAVDGTPVDSWWEFTEEIRKRAGDRTELLIERDGSRIVRVVTPEPTEETDPATDVTQTVGKVGIYPPAGDIVYESVSPATALAYGFRETVAVTGVIVGFLGDLFTGGVSPRSVGSIVTIGEASGQAAAAGMETFLRFMALFSVNLAVLNLLPIPILDGGHLLFLGIEAVRGKALSVEQRLKWSNIGFLIVMALMVWALSNDVLRLFGL